MSEARTDERLDRLEADVREIKTTLAGLAPIIHRIDATLPHLGTKAELAELRTDLQTEVGTLRTELAKNPATAMLGW